MKLSFVLLLLLLFILNITYLHGAPENLRAFQDAINNAIKELHSSNEWKYALSYSSIDYDSIAKCNPKRGYPPTLTLNSTEITMCRDKGALLPWVVTSTTGYYVTVGNSILTQLKKRYSNLANVSIKWIDVDVSKSFFPSMKEAVNSGQCDLVISEINVTEEREKEIDFGCSHSAGRDSVLRSGLEPNRVLNTVEKLNDPTVKVGISAGTVYTSFKDESFPLANVTMVASVEQGFQMIKNEELHAFFWGEVSVKSWIKANCEDCIVYPYGESAQYGLLFAQDTTSTAAVVSSVRSLFGYVLLMVAVLAVQLLM